MIEGKTKKITLTAVFLALGIVLPFFTGQIPQIGGMLLPMHIPIFLCSFICGWCWGVPIAIILPLFRSSLFGAPNMYPQAISIACEMAVYAFVSGFIYNRFKNKNLPIIYLSLISAMILGRAVRCLVQLSLLNFRGLPFSFEVFFSSVIVLSVPGIILQLVVIPLTLVIVNKILNNKK